MSQTKYGFKAWMKEVDKWLIHLSGFSHRCLADYCYYDSFEAEVSPKEVAVEVLIENDYPEDLILGRLITRS